MFPYLLPRKRASAFFNARVGVGQGESDRNRGMDYFRRSILEDIQNLSWCQPIAELEASTQELPPLRCKTELPELPFSSLP
jgi:hypothetical protein